MNVIIVEDEFLAQQELSWLIKEHSQMEIVGTFDDGLDVLKFLQHNRVDAIFLDINMPGRHGIVCLKEIRQLPVYDNVPVIMYSHARNPEEIEACRQAGASLYVSKPTGYLSMEKIFRQIFSMNWPERPWIMDKENFVLNNP